MSDALLDLECRLYKKILALAKRLECKDMLKIWHEKTRKVIILRFEKWNDNPKN